MKPAGKVAAPPLESTSRRIAPLSAAVFTSAVVATACPELATPGRKMTYPAEPGLPPPPLGGHGGGVAPAAIAAASVSLTILMIASQMSSYSSGTLDCGIRPRQ